MTLRRSREQATHALTLLARRGAAHGWQVDLLLDPDGELDLRLKSDQHRLQTTFYGETVMLSQSKLDGKPMPCSNLNAVVVDLSTEHPQSKTELQRAASYLYRALRHNWASVNLTRGTDGTSMNMTLQPHHEINTQYIELHWDADGELERRLCTQHKGSTLSIPITDAETVRQLNTSPMPPATATD